MRLHDLRHHSATALLKSGVSVGEVMDRHGWTAMDMVSRYRHMMEAKDHGAAETLERLASSKSTRTSTGGAARLQRQNVETRRASSVHL